MLIQTVLLLVSLCTASSYTPNIIIITADDMGFADVGWNTNGASVTPYLDEYKGFDDSTVLTNYYVMPNGHATRSALLTAKHPAVLGTQFEVNDGTVPYGLDPSHTLLPEYLKDLGYSCHAVGQWDLGFYSRDMLPTNRGYDTFYGSYLSYGDYSEHTAADNQFGSSGLDLHDNTEIDRSEDGTFKPELYARKAEDIIVNHDYSKPLHLYLAFQSAQIEDWESLCRNGDKRGKIPNDYYRMVTEDGAEDLRNCYLALITAVDTAYGRLMQALTNIHQLSNSIVIFTTTSGGPSAGASFNAASNFPFRGAKLTGWEGGVKGIALVYSEKFERPQSDCLFHVTDWIPTILTVYKEARGDLTALSTEKFKPMYGIDQYQCVAKDESSNRYDIIHFLYGKSASIQVHGNKYLVNTDGKLAEMDEWYSETGAICGQSSSLPCNPTKRACFFDIVEDPCEMRNIIDYPNSEPLVAEIESILASFNKTVKYGTIPEPEKQGSPKDGEWQPWVDSVNSSAVIRCTYIHLISSILILTAYFS